ncbi:transducin beta-like protein 3 [Vespula squamosa]|uniref:Transducin beta-like protein 3 n=1 Tax=Vespula squamosa TaxID=30214 RepID=A0ABD2AW42_VESSQ
MNKSTLKEAFEIESMYGAFYTGGDIHWTIDGKHIFCQKCGVISVLSVDTGTVIQSLGVTEEEQDEDTIHCFAVNDDNLHILAHCKSSLFKLWNWKENKLIKIWKSIHKGPVVKISFLNRKNLMASGGSDGSIRLWDLQHHTCINNIKGIQGVISVLAFHPDIKKELLFGAGDDTKIHGWDINTGQEKIVLSGHFSKVTSLCFHHNGINLISSGRDRVLILWDISSATSVRVLPVYEGIEGAFIVPNNISFPNCPHETKADSIYIASGGEKGVVNIWEMNTGRKCYAQQNSLVSTAKEEGGLSIMHLLYNQVINSFAVVSVDHNIIIHTMNTFECTKQIVGYTDEILDIAYIGNEDSHIALASNSSDIKLYELNSMNCQLLSGHTDIVLSLATTPANRQLLISSAKDNSIRIWFMDKETTKMTCIASAIRHTASVGSVIISQLSAKFFASVSQDSCLKLWSLPENVATASEHIVMNATHTVLAHQKDINSVTISPNDKFIATGSQDKAAKLWSADDLQLLGVFNGHRRGVWCVRFSPIDQVLLTTSADCTIKIWSLSDLSCLKTLQGHESSVLRAEFMSRGMQLITAGADGLLKLWSIKTSECVCTLDKHENRVWALVVSKDEKHVISGGSDSLLVIWRDVTEEKKTQIAAEKERIILEEQKLANLLQANELSTALQIALELERPLQVLRIVEGILKGESNELRKTIHEMTPSCKEALLRCAITWNTNSKNAQAAQTVIHVLTSEMEIEDLQTTGLLSSLEGMIPYTERHFKRLTRLMQDLHLLTYTVNRMKPHITLNGTDNIRNVT